MNRRNNWRGVKEWRCYSLPFSTASDEACKLFDAALTQYMGWYSDHTLGGIEGTLSKLAVADPTCVMGRVIAMGLQVISSGRSPMLQPDYRIKLEALQELTKSHETTDWEKLHVQAISLLSDGYSEAACNTWEEILLTYPLDMLAIRFLFDMYLYMGCMRERRDSLARVLPHWKPDMPLYSYLHGLYCFGLCETNEFTKAELHGKKALELNPEDTWATHALLHVYDMSGRFDNAIQLLNSTVKQWEPQESLACHNYWHWAVYNVEQNNCDEALDIFDNEVLRRTIIGRSAFNVSDCSALLKRLEIAGISVGERWHDVYEICDPDIHGGNIFPFTDAHYLMCCLGAKHKDTARKMIDDIMDFLKEGDTDNHRVKREVGVALYQSLMAYDDGDFAKSVDLLHPIRYQIYKIGGSNTQRDVFALFLINAAMKSPEVRHNKLAKSLLAERKGMVEDSNLTERLIQRSLIMH